MGATHLLLCGLAFFLFGWWGVGERRDTHRGDDALPDLTLEAQIGLAQLGAFLTKLSNLCALWKMGIKGVANMLGDA
jgi:hypothetical protein